MHLNKATTPGLAVSGTDTGASREARILQYVSHVNILAQRLKSRVPASITLDDLVAAGTIGLIQAVDRFQPSRGLQFGTYARHRISGAMLDFLRDEDPLSRTERRRIRAMTPANTVAIPTTISLEQLPAHTACDKAAYPETDFINGTALEQARQHLSLRENRVIVLLFELEWNNREVARELGVKESRVSQIKHAALSKLRTRLEERRDHS